MQLLLSGPRTCCRPTCGPQSAQASPCIFRRGRCISVSGVNDQSCTLECVSRCHWTLPRSCQAGKYIRRHALRAGPGGVACCCDLNGHLDTQLHESCACASSMILSRALFCERRTHSGLCTYCGYTPVGGVSPAYWSGGLCRQRERRTQASLPVAQHPGEWQPLVRGGRPLCVAREGVRPGGRHKGGGEFGDALGVRCASPGADLPLGSVEVSAVGDVTQLQGVKANGVALYTYLPRLCCQFRAQCGLAAPWQPTQRDKEHAAWRLRCRFSLFFSRTARGRLNCVFLCSVASDFMLGQAPVSIHHTARPGARRAPGPSCCSRAL